MSYRTAKPGTPRMPDQQTVQAAPMPKRADLTVAQFVARLDSRDVDYWWKRIICVMRRPEGHSLMRCQIDFATRAWQYAGKPPEWSPPGYQERLEVEVPATDEDLPPV